MMMKHEQMVKFAYVKANKQPSYKFHHCFLTGFRSSLSSWQDNLHSVSQSRKRDYYKRLSVTAHGTLRLPNLK